MLHNIADAFCLLKRPTRFGNLQLAISISMHARLASADWHRVSFADARVCHSFRFSHEQHMKTATKRKTPPHTSFFRTHIRERTHAQPHIPCVRLRALSAARLLRGPPCWEAPRAPRASSLLNSARGGSRCTASASAGTAAENPHACRRGRLRSRLRRPR